MTSNKKDWNYKMGKSDKERGYACICDDADYLRGYNGSTDKSPPDPQVAIMQSGAGTRKLLLVIGYFVAICGAVLFTYLVMGAGCS